MPQQQNITVAIAQVAPVFLNLPASIDRAVDCIKRAADNGARVLGFAECWAPGYPVWLDFAEKAALWGQPGAKALFRLLAENAVVAGDDHLRKIQQVVDDTGVYVVFGTHERSGKTLYNTTFSFAPHTAPLPHRKLVPTYTERLVWGRGDGSTLGVRDADFGILGSLICWEHWMPLARAAMHAQSEAIHVAQWPVVNDVHQLASRHYAFEGRCAVMAAGSILSKSDIMDGFDSLKTGDMAARELLDSMPADDNGFIHSGGSAIIGPDSRYISEPVFNREIMLTGDINLAVIAEQALTLDTAGHYSRPDVFELSINTKPQKGVVYE